VRVQGVARAATWMRDCSRVPSWCTTFRLGCLCGVARRYISELVPQVGAAVLSFALINILWTRHHHTLAKISSAVGMGTRVRSRTFIFRHVSPDLFGAE
jgi:hypothetical protein